MPGQNSPATLERARQEISKIATAKNAQLTHFWWASCTGYLCALRDEGVIDLATKQMLDAEADSARDAWVAPVSTEARQAAQIEVDSATRDN